MPGFIDTHSHYPQTEMIASYGLQLLDWLKQYTFPTEEKFAERDHADQIAEFYCEQMLRNGTTTSGVFATIHPESVDAIFAAAARRDMCLVAGKVMMDRNAPASLCDESATELSAKCRADQSLAFAGARALRGDAAFRALLHARTTRTLWAVTHRASGSVPAVARR